ncbi:MAG: multicopper oxidase domain-containing protein [Vicinamibacteria bacterium]|nr:multicopper oxidase domain-containing protein [Vicinamibacteria bacterium]
MKHSRTQALRPYLPGALFLVVFAAACSRPATPTDAPRGGPFTGAGLPTLAGRDVTCAGPRQKSFTLEARETTVDLGMGMRFNAWTYNGKLPAPVLEACEGDRVKITMANHAGTAHGLDSHAFRTSMMHFGPVEPDESMVLDKTMDTPGAFMYHCASGPVTDLHIKSGLYGAMVVYPRDRRLPAARELVVVESAIYGDPDPSGLIPGTSPARAQRNDPAFMMFNGRLEHETLAVAPGERVRAYVVNVGPGVAAIHVMGTILETVYDGTAEVRNVQTYGIPAGSGAVIDFIIPETGTYGLVDHDRLSYLPYGMELTFEARATASPAGK